MSTTAGPEPPTRYATRCPWILTYRKSMAGFTPRSVRPRSALRAIRGPDLSEPSLHQEPRELTGPRRAGWRPATEAGSGPGMAVGADRGQRAKWDDDRLTDVEPGRGSTGRLEVGPLS